MTLFPSPAAHPHHEAHANGREGWLRAAVLGADDGIVSTTSLMIGVTASAAGPNAILLAGLAGMVAGSLSMAAGEYVSVSSQRDSEEASIAQEQRELATNPKDELRELALIYEKRGLGPGLAREVARQLSGHDVLEAHMRDELGLHEATRARPVQAAVVSAASFAAASLLPILALLAAPERLHLPVLALAGLASLALLGVVGGHLANNRKGRAALRVLVGGGLAMAISALVGRVLGAMGI
ncbi:MAG: VIT family protein [Holophaga sp.]|jgi:VIT1/CCC1 family predicted Fe2+/Mn2+ transporter